MRSKPRRIGNKSVYTDRYQTAHLRFLARERLVEGVESVERVHAVFLFDSLLSLDREQLSLFGNLAFRKRQSESGRRRDARGEYLGTKGKFRNSSSSSPSEIIRTRFASKRATPTK